MKSGTTLFDNGTKVDKWVPLSSKQSVKVGDRVLSARGTPGIIVEMVLSRDLNDDLCVGCIIYWYGNFKHMEDRIGEVSIKDCDWIEVESS